MRWMFSHLCPLLTLLSWSCCHGYNWSSINLPDDHMPYFFTNNQNIKSLCQEDDLCPYKDALITKKCWGYEKKCKTDDRMSNPVCSESSRGWASSPKEQLRQFWTSADFGYVVERKKEMTVMCAPQSPDDSSLECAKYARYCRAKNIYLDFRSSSFVANGRHDSLFEESSRFREDFLLENNIGGHCKLNKEALRAQSEHKSALQSWYAEMEHYTSLPFQPIDNQHCDIIIDKPTVFMKLDAGVNMFHHFCDFVNIYLSQHINNSFSTDIQLINWDTSQMIYNDLFKETFEAFSHHPIIKLNEFMNKRVCVRDAIFPLLPRMRWGMFYNMPLIPGCYGSSLFQAFSAHLVHRLHLPQNGPLGQKIRITLLSRESSYRNILNQDELIAALKTVKEYDVRLAAYRYKQMSYMEQVQISHNSDVFIGMHGAGLTHMLFQPDWGSVIELFNCGDPNCYLDLARLRGVKYFTWEKEDKLKQQDEGHHPTLGAHQKFTNYSFDVAEFMRLVAMAAEHVKSHPAYRAACQRRQDESNFLKDEL